MATALTHPEADQELEEAGLHFSSKRSCISIAGPSIGSIGDERNAWTSNGNGKVPPALGPHLKLRITGGLDVFLRHDTANADRMVRVIQAFGFGTTVIAREDFLKENGVIQLLSVSWRRSDTAKAPQQKLAAAAGIS